MTIGLPSKRRVGFKGAPYPTKSPLSAAKEPDTCGENGETSFESGLRAWSK